MNRRKRRFVGNQLDDLRTRAHNHILLGYSCFREFIEDEAARTGVSRSVVYDACKGFGTYAEHRTKCSVPPIPNLSMKQTG